MVNRGSVRRRNKYKFSECIRLRKEGLSYSEIRKVVPVAKSTLQNWLTFAGLTLTKEHLEIQVRKRLENKRVATEASRITRWKRREKDINQVLELHKKYFGEPFYNYGVALYESEGSKGTDCRFSNSDYRIVQVFLKFIERYFTLRRLENMGFDVYIHETRENDLEKITGFWSKKLEIPKNKIKIRWKKNKIVGRRDNPDYVGQMLVRVKGERILGSKIEAISDIILKKYQRI